MGVRLVKYNTTSGGGSGTFDHNLLENRDMADQHPVSAISGLEERLAEMMSEVEIIFSNIKQTLKDLEDTDVDNVTDRNILMYNIDTENWEAKLNNISLFKNDAGYIARHITAKEMQNIWDDIEIDWR